MFLYAGLISLAIPGLSSSHAPVLSTQHYDYGVLNNSGATQCIISVSTVEYANNLLRTKYSAIRRHNQWLVSYFYARIDEQRSVYFYLPCTSRYIRTKKSETSIYDQETSARWGETSKRRWQMRTQGIQLDTTCYSC